MSVRVKRVYEAADESDGLRVLVDRLWPRGVSKEKARIDHWPKALTPSRELRTWYKHDPQKWGVFRERFFAELDEQAEALHELRELMSQHKTVTLVFSSKETQLNNAHALKRYLEERP